MKTYKVKSNNRTFFFHAKDDKEAIIICNERYENYQLYSFNNEHYQERLLKKRVKFKWKDFIKSFFYLSC